jgi:putative ATPase
MADLFEQQARAYYRRHAPLAERMRPQRLDEFFGQAALVGEGRALRRAVAAGEPSSMILWGPPGTGKTTLAQLVARHTRRRFVGLSAVSSGVADIKRIIAEATRRLTHEERGTILFIDEIHRFNKAQQDALLKAVEEGTLTLVGATGQRRAAEPGAGPRARAARSGRLARDPASCAR